MPDDFRTYACVEGNLKLRKRYSVGGATIERWRAQIGARYNIAPMPKRAPPAAVKRVRARLRAQERLEDLNEFGADDLARSLDLKSFDREW